MATPIIQIEQRPFNTIEAKSLITKLDAELEEMYPDGDDFAHPNLPESVLTSYRPDLESSEPEKKGLIFFIAFQTTNDEETPQRQPIGCAAVELRDPKTPGFDHYSDPKLGPAAELKVGEIKRVYVDAAFRKQGVSAAMMAHVEKEARGRLGIKVLVVETGFRQVGAI